MACKVFILGLVLVAALLLISSEVSARELVEEAGAKEKEAIEGSKQYGGYGGYPGGGYGGYPGGGYGGYPRGVYYPPWRRPYPYCRWGCCGRGWYGRCRCCIYPGEVPEAGVEAEPKP
ncbi:hypothetical protein Taro_054465, partial [Colocasia esculenta]|nr:hypothetical protein [Colocasia esculenta]